MTRQRTLILTRMESSERGIKDVQDRKSGRFRYWLLVPFYSYIFMVDSFIILMRTLRSTLRARSRRN